VVKKQKKEESQRLLPKKAVGARSLSVGQNSRRNLYLKEAEKEEL